MEKLYGGIYRGEVVDNTDSFGRCRVFVRGVYPEEFRTNPMNLPLAEVAEPLFSSNRRFITSGSNDSEIERIFNLPAGHCSWLDVGAFCWVMFEGANHLHPIIIANIPASTSWTALDPGQTVINTNGINILIDETAIHKVDPKRIAEVTTLLLTGQEGQSNQSVPISVPIAPVIDMSAATLVSNMPNTTVDDKATIAAVSGTYEAAMNAIPGGSAGIGKIIGSIVANISQVVTKATKNVKGLAVAVDVNSKIANAQTVLATIQNPTGAVYKLGAKMLPVVSNLANTTRDDLLQTLLPPSANPSEAEIKRNALLKSATKPELVKALDGIIKSNPTNNCMYYLQNKLNCGKLGFIDQKIFSLAMQTLQIISTLVPAVTMAISTALKQILGKIVGSNIQVVYDADGRPTLRVVWGGDMEFIINGDITTIHNGTTTTLETGSNYTIAGPGTITQVPFPLPLTTIVKLATGGTPAIPNVSVLAPPGTPQGIPTNGTTIPPAAAPPIPPPTPPPPTPEPNPMPIPPIPTGAGILDIIVQPSIGEWQLTAPDAITYSGSGNLLDQHVAVGVYTIVYVALTGYTGTPTTQTQSVIAGVKTTFTGTYTGAITPGILSFGSLVWEESDNTWKLTGLTRTKFGIFIGTRDNTTKGNTRLYLNGNRIYNGFGETLLQGVVYGDGVYFPEENGNLLYYNSQTNTIQKSIQLGFSACCVIYQGIPYVINTHQNGDHQDVINCLTGNIAFTLNRAGISTQATEFDGKLWAACVDGNDDGVVCSDGTRIDANVCLCVIPFYGQLIYSSENKVISKTAGVIGTIDGTIMHMHVAYDLLWIACTEPDSLWTINTSGVLTQILPKFTTGNSSRSGSLFKTRVTDGFFGRSYNGGRAQVYQINGLT